MMSTHIRIDFVSDVVCPWCAIGLKSLEQALERLGDEVDAEIHFRPFELNPDMPPEGENIAEHLSRKYGSTPEQLTHNQEALRARGEALGFTFDMTKRTRVYNTFDAHRLLHFAEGEGKQRALKHALLHAYFTEGLNPSDPDVLTQAAVNVGLDEARVRTILSSDTYADEIRQQEAFYQRQGIRAVPSVIVDNQYLIQGGQPVEAFEQTLRQIASEKGAQAV
jgi:predicted DsbA family dithiol-disulfide isomerase